MPRVCWAQNAVPSLPLPRDPPHPCLEPLQPRTLEGTWGPRRAWNRIIPAQVVCVPCQVLPARPPPRPGPSSLGSSGPFRPGPLGVHG